MRFMLFMYPGIKDEEWDPTHPRTAEDVAAMSKYNEELTKAGVLLALDGLHPPGEGTRVALSDGKRTVTDGPFTEAKEIVGGYWIIQAKSKEEAVEWASRCPLSEGNMIEVRQVYEMSEFPEDVQKAAQLSQEPPEQTIAE